MFIPKNKTALLFFDFFDNPQASLITLKGTDI